MPRQSTKNPFSDEARIHSSSTPKRLIVCCDGTWKASDHATKGDSSYQTNITRMCHALADDGVHSNGKPIPQVVYYQEGLGTNIPTNFARQALGSIGWGINNNILAGYNFLVNNYAPDDEIFLFGFSRGSFTCRSLAGMVSEFGILKQEMSGEWFAGIWDRYQGTVTDERWEREKTNVAWNVKIKVMGCWDTVGNLGIPESWFTKLLGLHKKYAFHNTELSDKIENAFHVLALDESRSPFSPTLWYIPPSNTNEDRRTQLKQCWFPGVHTDVGRGYNDHVPGDIADITFAWMVDQCIGHLSFREETLDWMMEHGDFKDPPPEGKEERQKREERATHWGMADVHDSSTGLVAVLTGPKTRTPGQYAFKSRHLVQARDGSWTRITGAADTSSDRETSMVTAPQDGGNATPATKPWYKRFGVWLKGVVTHKSGDERPVAIHTSEYIHPCVRVRMLNDPTYDPPSLRDYKPVYNVEHDQWSWIKQWAADDGGVHKTELLEYRIPEVSFAGTRVDRETLGYGEGQNVTIPPRVAKKPWWKFW